MHAAATSNVQRKAGRNALMLEPPWRLVPSEVNLLGARAGTESVSTPSNVIADARLVHARSCELPEMSIQLQVIIRSTAFKRDSGTATGPRPPLLAICAECYCYLLPITASTTTCTSEQCRLTQENWTRASPGQVGFCSASQPSPGPCQALA